MKGPGWCVWRGRRWVLVCRRPAGRQGELPLAARQLGSEDQTPRETRHTDMLCGRAFLRGVCSQGMEAQHPGRMQATHPGPRTRVRLGHRWAAAPPPQPLGSSGLWGGLGCQAQLIQSSPRAHHAHVNFRLTAGRGEGLGSKALVSFS